LTAHLVGDRPLRTTVKGGAQLSAGAFLGAGDSAGRMSVALVDFDEHGASPLVVRLHVPAGFAVGSVLRLTGPSATAGEHVALGGAEVAASGAWHPKLRLTTVTGSSGSVSVHMQPSSAALVTLYRPQRR
jgi:hypothetical protein